jgi:hypothetical protein
MVKNVRDNGALWLFYKPTPLSPSLGTQVVWPVAYERLIVDHQGFDFGWPEIGFGARPTLS